MAVGIGTYNTIFEKIYMLDRLLSIPLATLLVLMAFYMENFNQGLFFS